MYALVASAQSWKLRPCTWAVVQTVICGYLLIAAVDEPIQGEREREVKRDIEKCKGRQGGKIDGALELLGGALFVFQVFSFHPT